MTRNEPTSDFGSYAALFRRRRAWIFTIFPAFLLAAVYLAYALPPKYRSTATILLVQGSIPEQFIQATVASSADEEIETIQGRVMTLEAMKGLVQQIDPYPKEVTWDIDKKAQQIILDTTMERVDPVTFEVLLKSPAFSLHYDNPNPRMAAVITKRLSDLFLTYHQRERVEAAKAAASLIQDRASQLSQELQKVDQEYAVLRSQHGGTLPDPSDRGDDARYRAERDLNDLEKQLRTAQEQESLLTIQLSATSRNLLSTQSLGADGKLNSQGVGAEGGLTDLATVKALLADAELRYTPDHPDVKRLKRALAALQAQQQQTGSTAPEADNPEYRRISSELVAARSEVTALTTATARARAQLERYTENTNPSAALAQQVAELDRRRSSLQTEFQDVQGKLKSAQLGQDIEADPHAEHFTLLRAPVVAPTPFSPNRLGVILLGLVLGGAIAAVAVAAAEGADVTVRGVRDVVGFAPTVQVLGTVSEILIPADLRRRRLIWGSVSVLYVAAVIFVGVTIVQATERDHIVQATGST
jgi:uncharacterized protein involved in exopolysaccharide biosynthesis